MQCRNNGILRKPSRTVAVPSWVYRFKSSDDIVQLLFGVLWALKEVVQGMWTTQGFPLDLVEQMANLIREWRDILPKEGREISSEVCLLKIQALIPSSSRDDVRCR